MNLSELQSSFTRKKVITYASDHNTAVEKSLPIQHICGNLYKGKGKKDRYGQTFCQIYMYFEEFNVGMDIGSILSPEECTAEELVRKVSSNALQSAQEVISTLDSIVASGGRIRNAEIALARYLAPEKADGYFAARQKYIEKDELEKKRNRQKRDAEDAAYCEQQNKVAQCQVEEAIRIILNGGQLRNDKITFYKSRYSSSSYAMVNHLARQYKVEIPLKVQGWINRCLLDVTIADGRAASYHYKAGKSNTISGYIIKLVVAIQQSHLVDGAA